MQTPFNLLLTPWSPPNQWVCVEERTDEPSHREFGTRGTDMDHDGPRVRVESFRVQVRGYVFGEVGACV